MEEMEDELGEAGDSVDEMEDEMEEESLKGPEGAIVDITINSIETGDWLAVVYDDHWWLGKSIDVDIEPKTWKLSLCILMALLPIFTQNMGGEMSVSVHWKMSFWNWQGQLVPSKQAGPGSSMP